MIAAGFILISLGYLLIHSGFVNSDPREEVAAAFRGKAVQADKPSGNSGDVAGSASPSTEPATGKLVKLPARYCQLARPMYVDSSVYNQVVYICERFGVKVSSAYRTVGQNQAAHGAEESDHLCGLACDFVGNATQMAALYRWADGMFAYLEPMGDSKNHVHISFRRCGQRL